MRAAYILAVLAWSAVASADPTKEECVDADTRAQTLRMQGKFHDARAQLDVCTSPACPALVRQDCTERLDDVNRAQPSVVFDVKDASGADIGGARVTMDSQPLLDHIGGASVAVDPGEHTFVIAARGHLPNTEHVVVHEGDKERRIKVVVGTAALEQPRETPAASPEPITTPPSESAPTVAAPGRGQRIEGIVVGVVGLVGLGVGGGLAGAASSSWQTSLSECSTPTNCTNHDQAVVDHDNAVGLATGSTVAFIAGGVLAATGLVLFLTAPHGKPDSPSAWRIMPVMGSSGGAVFLSRGF